MEEKHRRDMGIRFTAKDILIGARSLLEVLGWNQGQYAIKDSKTFFDFLSSGKSADSYCLLGALEKATHDLIQKITPTSWEAQHSMYLLRDKAEDIILAIEGFNGNLAEWNDQDEEKMLLDTFIAGLKEKKMPRDKAAVEISNFKKELKARNIKPIMTKERVLSVLNKAIGLLEQKEKEE
jgi:hypothetical protein